MKRQTETLLATKGGFSLDEIAEFRRWLSSMDPDDEEPSEVVSRIIRFLVREGYWS